MISIKRFLLFALAAPALAGYQCKNTEGNFVIKYAYADEALAHAPPDGDAGKSGYPHPFQNTEQIKWETKGCQGKHRRSKMLEFPVLENGELYDYKKSPKDEPGPARIAYLHPGKVLCGVISHKKGSGDFFDLCESDLPPELTMEKMSSYSYLPSFAQWIVILFVGFIGFLSVKRFRHQI